MVDYCDISWSDNALLLIMEPIPIQYNVYYAGVDITARNAGDAMTCIHHSMGKPKKIITGKLQHFAGPKWEIYWDNGIIRGGGSGAPVFLNSNKRVVATVSGGLQNLDCSNNLKQEWVGKLRSCNDIKDVLFGNSGLTSIAGIDRNRSCQSNLNLSGDFHTAHDYDATLNGLTIQANNTITSTATFHPGSNYTLTAGSSIAFLPGTVIAGSNVNAKIAPCTVNLATCGTHSSNYKSIGNYSQEFDENDPMEYSKDILEKDEHNTGLITVIPNPNNGTFTISATFDSHEIISVKVFNMLGQNIYTQSELTTPTVQLPQLAKGMFFVEVLTVEQKFIRKVLVQ